MHDSPIRRDASMREFGPWKQFSPREQDIIAGLLQARSVREIADDLHITVNTVKDYIKTIYQKAQVHSARALLIKFYLDRPPARPGRSRDLADAIQKLLDSRSRELVLETLVMAAKTCTGGHEAMLFGLAEGAVLRHGRDRYLMPAEWSQALQAAPYFQSHVSSGSSLPPPFRWSHAGGGEIIGVRLDTEPEAKLLAVSEPLGGRFEETALPTVRILACVAEREWQTAVAVAP